MPMGESQKQDWFSNQFNLIYATPKIQRELLRHYSHPVTKDHEGGAYGSRDMLQTKKKKKKKKSNFWINYAN